MARRFGAKLLEIGLRTYFFVPFTLFDTFHILLQNYSFFEKLLLYSYKFNYSKTVIKLCITFYYMVLSICYKDR